MFGYFGRFINRNEKTGYSTFTLVTSDITYICTGICPYFSKKLPLEVIGKETINGKYHKIEVSDINISDYDYMSTITYISEQTIKGFGIVKAKKLVDKFDGNIFTTIYNSNTLNDLSAFCSTNDERKVIENIREITEFLKLYKFLLSYEGDYYNSKNYFEEYSTDSQNVIKNNPYTLMYADVPFNICEKIAIDMNIPEYDRRRIKALVYNIVDNNSKSGNTRIDYSKLINRIAYVENNNQLKRHTEEVFIKEELLDHNYVLEEENENIYIYKKEDYSDEISVIQNINRLNHSKEIYSSVINIEEIEQNNGIFFSEEQKDSFNCLTSSGIKIITGGPGTGKTTLLKGLLEAYEKMHPQNSIVLCSPTGRAAKRMNEVTDMEAHTIHHLLKIQPFETRENTEINEKLDASLVVVDECSMIDTYLMSRLLSVLKNNVTLILIGDADQLPSVGAGNVLGDLLKSNEIEHYCLTTIYRQEGINSIVLNSKNIIGGDRVLRQDNNFRVVRCSNSHEMEQEIEALAGRYEHLGLKYNIYTPVRKKKYEVSTVNINRKLKDKFNRSDIKDSILYGDNIYSVGDHVIFCRNNYEEGYYNGQDGIITVIQKVKDKYYITINTEGNSITISSKLLDDLELGYAITAHKAQGSEIDHAIIVIPKEPANMLLRQLVYVEVTRAKKSVTIISERNALETAISEYREIKRETGLYRKLIAG